MNSWAASNGVHLRYKLVSNEYRSRDASMRKTLVTMLKATLAKELRLSLSYHTAWAITAYAPYTILRGQQFTNRQCEKGLAMIYRYCSSRNDKLAMGSSMDSNFVYDWIQIFYRYFEKLETVHLNLREIYLK